MSCLQILSSNIIVMFLGLCLQLLATGEVVNTQNLLEVNVVPMGTAKPGEKVELACRVQSFWKDCLSVKVYTLSNVTIDFPYGNFNYIYCSCPGETKTFYWNIRSSRTVNVGCRAIFVLDNACPEEQNSIPPQSKRRDGVNMKTLKISA